MNEQPLIHVSREERIHLGTMSLFACFLKGLRWRVWVLRFRLHLFEDKITGKDFMSPFTVDSE